MEAKVPLRLDGTAEMLAENINRHVSILLVEDNEDDVLLTLRALQKSFVKLEDVAVVRDGKEAQDYLFARGPYQRRNQAITPNLVLLDINLPKMNGLELLRTIRKDPRTRVIPVVMFSSSADTRDLAASYGYGANGYIRKPVNSQRFEEVVQQVVKYWLGINRCLAEYQGGFARPA